MRNQAEEEEDCTTRLCNHSRIQLWKRAKQHNNINWTQTFQNQILRIIVNRSWHYYSKRHSDVHRDLVVLILLSDYVIFIC